MPRAALPINAKIRSDLTRLERLHLERKAREASDYVPPLAQITVTQRYEIERLAGQGFNLGQIGVYLGLDAEIWSEMVSLNPVIGRTFREGMIHAQDRVSKRLLDAAENDHVDYAWKWAERVYGQQYAPPKTGPAVVVQQPAAVVNLDDSRIQAAFDKQTRLLDAEFEEVKPEREGSG